MLLFLGFNQIVFQLRLQYYTLFKAAQMLRVPQNNKFDYSTLLKGISESSFEMHVNQNSNVASSNINSMGLQKNRTKIRRQAQSSRISNLLPCAKEDQYRLIQKSLNNSYFGMLALANNSKIKEISKLKHKQTSCLRKKQKLQQEYISEISNTNTATSGHRYSEVTVKIDLSIQYQRTTKQTSLFSMLINGKVDDLLCCRQATQIKVKYQGIINNSTLLLIPNIKNQYNQQYQINLNAVQCSLKRYQLPATDYSEQEIYAIFKIGQNVRFSLSCCKLQQKWQYAIKKFNSWLQMLQISIQNSFAKKFEIKQPNDVQDLEKKRYKLERQFVNQCETGDILLFQGNSFSCKAQRFLTSSDFDHIAMVIKDPTYGIIMYEAMGKNGVNLTPWRLMIENDWFRYVNRISWRKLIKIQRTAQFQQLIESFVRRNISAQYHISLQKLISNESISETVQDRGYFCSELIAKVYKAIGLLAGQKDKHNKDYKPAHKYYPSHFAQKGRLNLLKGELSPEYQIVFCDKILAQDYSQF